MAGQGDWGVCGAECPSEKNVCPPTWSLTKAGCYKVVPGDSQESRLTKEAARAACEEAGGYLAEVTSREEQEQLEVWLQSSNSPGLRSDRLYQAQALWLGLHNDSQSNVWVWDRSGQPVDYNNWLDTEPTHANDNERCAGMFVDRNFNNEFALKPAGWFAMNCGHAGFDFYKNWRVNSQALCERDVLESALEEVRQGGEQEEEERVVGPEGCYESKIGCLLTLNSSVPQTGLCCPLVVISSIACPQPTGRRERLATPRAVSWPRSRASRSSRLWRRPGG